MISVALYCFIPSFHIRRWFILSIRGISQSCSTCFHDRLKWIDCTSRNTWKCHKVYLKSNTGYLSCESAHCCKLYLCCDNFIVKDIFGIQAEKYCQDVLHPEKEQRCTYMAWTEVAFEIFALMLSQIILVLLDSSRLFFTWSQPANDIPNCKFNVSERWQSNC